MNQPERGAVITEYTLEGVPHRNIGLLRATGHEADPDLHRALNTGIPLVNPQGGYYFVFQTGEPRFRKYDARGTLLFERVIQGTELDAWLASQPTTWPARRGPRELPVVPPIVRTAAVDRAGGLWIAFTLPFTYVYDADGEKTRVVQFHGAGIIAPTSLSFARDGTAAGHTGLLRVRPAARACGHACVTNAMVRCRSPASADADLHRQPPGDQPGACYDPAHRYDTGTAGRC